MSFTPQEHTEHDPQQRDARKSKSAPATIHSFGPKVASLLLVAVPGAPSSVLAPSSKARSP